MAKTLIAFFSRADENYFGGAMRYVKEAAAETQTEETKTEETQAAETPAAETQTEETQAEAVSTETDSAAQG